MPRNYNVKNALLGATYDANRMLEDNKTKDAFKLLKKKIKDIEKLERYEWATVEW